MSKMKFIASVLFLCVALGAMAQIPGKKNKDPYVATDGVEYKVGDIVRLGVPAKGDQFEQIATYKKTSFLDAVGDVLTTVSDVASGTLTANSSNPNVFGTVDKSYANKKAIIEYFSVFEPKGKPELNSVYVAAKMIDDPRQNIAFEMNLSLKNGELFSNNPDFAKSTSSDAPVEQGTSVTQFSSKIYTEFLGAKGSKDQQTVTINLLMSHKQVHQAVMIRTGECSLYDMEGNEYKGSVVAIGNENRTYQVMNKIPTEVPVKVSVTFNKMLPSVGEIRYGAIKIHYDNLADYNDGWGGVKNEGTLELRNLKVDWE